MANKKKKKKGINNENKRLLIIGSIILGIILLFTLIAVIDNGEKTGILNTNLKLYQDILKSNDTNIIYVSAASCSHCQNFEPILKNVVKEYDLKLYKIDLDKYSQDDKTNLYNSLEFFSTEWGTPSILIVKNGKLIESLVGERNKDQLIKLFKNHNIIKTTSSDISYLTNVDVNGYMEAIESEDTIIMFIASSSCPNCEKTTPILEELIKEENIKIYYIDLDEIETEEDYNTLIDSFDIYLDPDFGVPTTLIIKNHNIIDTLNGYRTKDSFITFFKKNGFIVD